MYKTIALAIALVALAASGAAAAAAAEANFGIRPPPPSGVDKEGSWYVGENLKVGDKEGSWYVGENLKVGDYFSYDLCHVRYGNCTEFNMKIWFKERAQTRDETWWLADVVVTDGDRIVVGEMSFDGRVLAHVGTDQELREYGEAFNLSVLFLSYLVQFGSDSGGGEKGKKFTDTWLAMIGELCGLRVAPSGLEDVTVPAGTWEDAVVVSWIGCDNGKTWIADEFPFPLKADAYRATSEGQLRIFAFVLVDYDNVQESPFAGIVSTPGTERIGCGADIKRVVPVEKATDGFKYVVHVSYGPDEAVEGCWMEWQLKFKGKEAVPELLDRVLFDILVLDDDGGVVRSVASEHGNSFLYAPSGLYLLQFEVKEPPGIAEYTVVVYGLAPEGVLPRPGEQDALTVQIDVRPKDGAAGGVADDPARAEAEKSRSPRLQVLDGVPADEVACSYGSILMTSPSGTPACVFETSGDMLEQRGFVKVSGADSEESSTDDAEQRPPLHRGPYEPPIIDTTGRPDGSFEVITESLDELRSAKHAPRQSSSDGFVVADWIPDYIPKGYRLVHTLHQTWPDYNNGTNHHLNLYFAPDSFNFTSSATHPDLWGAGGIFYAVQPNNSDKYDSYENIRESPGPLVNPFSIINQTNGYFGLQKLDNGYFGLQNPDNGYTSFSVVAAFETQKIHIATRADIPHAEGTKMINSIQGVLFPE